MRSPEGEKRNKTKDKVLVVVISLVSFFFPMGIRRVKKNWQQSPVLVVVTEEKGNYSVTKMGEIGGTSGRAGKKRKLQGFISTKVASKFGGGGGGGGSERVGEKKRQSFKDFEAWGGGGGEEE